MKMSITRALREVKLLEDRIGKKLGNLNLVDIAKGEKPVMMKDSSLSVQEFKAMAIGDIQSLEKLMDNLLKVKSALLKANNETSFPIKIGKKEMILTIAESIDMKNRIQIKKEYLNTMKKSLVLAERKMNDANKQVDIEISALRSKTTDTADAVTSRDNQIKELEKSKFNIINPEGILLREKVAEIEEEIETFESDIDYLLSEVNAKTEIEVDYNEK